MSTFRKKETPAQYAERQKRRPITVATSPPLLYVDGLNYVRQILGRKWVAIQELCEDVDVFSDLKTAEVNVETFMREADRAGWKVTVFIDNAKVLLEEQELYWQRATQNMQEGGRDIVAFIGVLLGSLFQRHGAKVHFAMGADNDATMAAFAIADDAAILSGDSDFLRYYERRATGEMFFLRRLFSGYAAGDERNQGRLALFNKQISEDVLRDRQRPDWVLTTGIGQEKGKKIRFLPYKPATSDFFDFITERDECGNAAILLTNASAYPFSFLCAASEDLSHLTRPLRLAVASALGESCLVEKILRWIRVPVDSDAAASASGDSDPTAALAAGSAAGRGRAGGRYGIARCAYMWARGAAGAWALVPIRVRAGDSDGALLAVSNAASPSSQPADSWEDFADLRLDSDCKAPAEPRANGSLNGDLSEPLPVDGEKVRDCEELLRRLGKLGNLSESGPNQAAGPGPAAAQSVTALLMSLYDLLFPDGSLPTTLWRPAGVCCSKVECAQCGGGGGLAGSGAGAPAAGQSEGTRISSCGLSVRPTALQARNEELNRFMYVVRMAGAAVPAAGVHRDAFVHLGRFAAALDARPPAAGRASAPCS